MGSVSQASTSITGGATQTPPQTLLVGLVWDPGSSYYPHITLISREARSETQIYRHREALRDFRTSEAALWFHSAGG